MLNKPLQKNVVFNNFHSRALANQRSFKKLTSISEISEISKKEESSYDSKKSKKGIITKKDLKQKSPPSSPPNIQTDPKVSKTPNTVVNRGISLKRSSTKKKPKRQATMMSTGPKTHGDPNKFALRLMPTFRQNTGNSSDIEGIHSSRVSSKPADSSEEDLEAEQMERFQMGYQFNLDKTIDIKRSTTLSQRKDFFITKNRLSKFNLLGNTPQQRKSKDFGLKKSITQRNYTPVDERLTRVKLPNPKANHQSPYYVKAKLIKDHIDLKEREQKKQKKLLERQQQQKENEKLEKQRNCRFKSRLQFIESREFLEGYRSLGNKKKKKSSYNFIRKGLGSTLEDLRSQCLQMGFSVDQKQKRELIKNRVNLLDTLPDLMQIYSSLKSRSFKQNEKEKSLNLFETEGEKLTRAKNEEERLKIIIKDKKLRKFFLDYFTQKNLNRIKTFEKFGFKSLERRDAKHLFENLAEIRNQQPRSTMNVNEFWGRVDERVAVSETNYLRDKKLLKRYHYLTSFYVKHLKKMRAGLLKKGIQVLSEQEIDDMRLKFQTWLMSRKELEKPKSGKTGTKLSSLAQELIEEFSKESGTTDEGGEGSDELNGVSLTDFGDHLEKIDDDFVEQVMNKVASISGTGKPYDSVLRRNTNPATDMTQIGLNNTNNTIFGGGVPNGTLSDANQTYEKVRGGVMDQTGHRDGLRKQVDVKVLVSNSGKNKDQAAIKVMDRTAMGRILGLNTPKVGSPVHNPDIRILQHSTFLGGLNQSYNVAPEKTNIGVALNRGSSHKKSTTGSNTQRPFRVKTGSKKGVPGAPETTRAKPRVLRKQTSSLSALKLLRNESKRRRPHIDGSFKSSKFKRSKTNKNSILDQNKSKNEFKSSEKSSFPKVNKKKLLKKCKTEAELVEKSRGSSLNLNQTTSRSARSSQLEKKQISKKQKKALFYRAEFRKKQRKPKVVSHITMRSSLVPINQLIDNDPESYLATIRGYMVRGMLKKQNRMQTLAQKFSKEAQEREKRSLDARERLKKVFRLFAKEHSSVASMADTDQIESFKGKTKTNITTSGNAQ